MEKIEYKKHLFDAKTGGITLKAARVNAGLTQTQAAEEMCVSKEAILKWEQGQIKRPMKPYLKKRIAEVYGISEEIIKWPNEADNTEDKQ